MIKIRKSDERGHADHGWLNTHFTFSFADYFDPEHVQFRTLRVMNDDRVAGGGGFPMHPHRDMEIVTYVLEGALRTSRQHGQRLGDQAGRRAVHERGHRRDAQRVQRVEDRSRCTCTRSGCCRISTGIKPAYDQKKFSDAEKRGKLRLVASPDGRDGSVKIRQDNELYATVLGAGDSVKHALKPERHAYVQVARGSVTLNGKRTQRPATAPPSPPKSRSN